MVLPSLTRPMLHGSAHAWTCPADPWLCTKRHSLVVLYLRRLIQGRVFFGQRPSPPSGQEPGVVLPLLSMHRIATGVAAPVLTAPGRLLPHVPCEKISRNCVRLAVPRQ